MFMRVWDAHKRSNKGWAEYINYPDILAKNHAGSISVCNSKMFVWKRLGKPGKYIPRELKPTWVSADRDTCGVELKDDDPGTGNTHMSLALGPSVQRTSGARVPR